MLNSTITNKVTSILVPEYNGKENPEGSYTKKYQKDIVAVMAIIQYVSIITLVSLLRHAQVRVLFSILLIVLLKNINIAVP